MSNDVISILRKLGRAALAGDGIERSDHELLNEFIDRRSEAAFEALLYRHGPMVFGVCLRVLRHRQDAEDAFQATFLVLSCKAASVVPRQMVGNWLYGVAYQTAIRARAIRAQRQAREKQVAIMPEPAAESHDHWPDLRLVLDEEMNQLPARYRAVLILCDVEGRTRKDAARHLGCPEGSVSSRLSRGREMLTRRLARRGIALSAAALVAVLADYATAAAPVELIGSTIKTAFLILACDAAAAVSPQVAALVKGTVGAMAYRKLVSTFVLVVAVPLTLAAAGVGAGFLYAHQTKKSATHSLAPRSAQADPPKDDVKKKPAKPESQQVAAPRKLGRIPDPPLELQAEFARWDSTYRHQSPAKFQELEQLAARFIDKYPDRDNQARIYFQVAHITGQSWGDRVGVAEAELIKHLERMRKYGQKVLEISRDPIERGWIYSYLGSAAEIDPRLADFAERRRLAADPLLAGYAEALAQDLPKFAPELPVLEKIGPEEGSDPVEQAKRRAQHAAQIEARRDAEWVRDLVQRRETLAIQLRWLYRPDLKVHGRDADGPDEIRALATKKLHHAAAVAELLARVTGPELRRPEPGWHVQEVAGELVQISAGNKHGLKVGDKLEVYRLTPARVCIADLRVLAVEEDSAVAKSAPQPGQTIAVNDLVAREPAGK
jgi:RNA polymerase sigma factor (sigma-70 family)